MKLKIGYPLFFLDEKYKELKEIMKNNPYYYDVCSIYSDKYITQDIIISFEQNDKDIYICTKNNKIKLFGNIIINKNSFNNCSLNVTYADDFSLEVEEYELVNQNIFAQHIYAENHIKNFLEDRTNEKI